jgi:AcrR family transcriptional regulator
MKTLDRRAARSRELLLRAFRDLVLRQPYESLSVADVAAQAGVGRSTLYQHFAGKNALLAASIAHPLAGLARLVEAEAEPAHLVPLLEHFWGNRALARAVFTGHARRVATQVLVTLIEQRLTARGFARRGALILPMRLAAVQLADMMLAPIIAWLLGESRSTPQVLAGALPPVVNATVTAMISPRFR